MTKLCIGLLVLCLSGLSAAEVRADSGADDVASDGSEQSMRAKYASLAKEIAKRAVRRGRRSISLGPSVGVAPSIGLDSGDTDMALSFGIALLKYDIPLLPTGARMVDIIKSRFLSQLKNQLRAAIKSGKLPRKPDRERIAREVWEEIKAEFLLEVRPQRWEKPSAAVRLEVVNLTSANAWDVRALVGIGLGPVYFSLGPSLRYDDGAVLVAPIELSKPMLISKGLRSPVVEFYLRAEVAVTGRTKHEDYVLLGARFMLDVI